MSKSPLPLVIEDLSAFATSLRHAWPGSTPLAQTEALGLIAKAAGYRNHQHLKAAAAPVDDPLDSTALKQIKDALRVFDDAGVMQRWPRKTSVQRLCLIWFWSRLPARQDMTEAEVNAILQDGAAFGDHVLIRRSLIDGRLVERTTDGRVYRRREARPTAQERALIRTLSERVAARELS